MIKGKHSLKISAPQLLRFGIDNVLKIMNKRMTKLVNRVMNELGAAHKLCQRPKRGWGGGRKMLTMDDKGGRGGKANADFG